MRFDKKDNKIPNGTTIIGRVFLKTSHHLEQ